MKKDDEIAIRPEEVFPRATPVEVYRLDEDGNRVLVRVDPPLSQTELATLHYNEATKRKKTKGDKR